jgi:hypothetical protein
MARYCGFLREEAAIEKGTRRQTAKDGVTKDFFTGRSWVCVEPFHKLFDCGSVLISLSEL